MRRFLVCIVLISFLFGCSTYEIQLKDDPCNDKYLKQLEQKSSLNVDEIRAYAELKRLCQERRYQERQLSELEDISTATMFSAYFSVVILAAAIAAAIIK